MTWRARHLGIWQHLTSRITAFDSLNHFRDFQVRGAFRRFDHDHFFSERGETTAMRDVFDFQSPLGILGNVADFLFLKRYLKEFLITRNALIKETAETDQWRHFLPELG